MEERLQKILSAHGVSSRRAAEGYLSAGRVTVNGCTARVGDKADPERDDIRVDGRPLRRPARRTYLMLNKPRGYVTTLSDERGRRTVAQLVSGCGARVWPVGRLDLDSEGLLLLTNDGDLAHRILSPRSGVWKTYYAEHEGTASAEDCAAFEAGLTLGDGTKCLPARLEPQGHGKSLIHVQEGKYHQVRRMMAARGMPVTYLKRIAEGGLTLGGLEKGAVAELDVV